MAAPSKEGRTGSVTLADIAHKAGVSPIIASRALRGSSLVAQATPARVPAVAAKSPNPKLALEVANAFADVEVGDMWMAQTGIQTGIRTDPAKIESPISGTSRSSGRSTGRASGWI